MNVVDIPKPASHALYDEAMTRYAELVRSRAIAVYRLGPVRHPGVSDADMLVVTDRAHLDNRWFFSALARLPERFHRIFMHEPFVLPVWSLRVMRYVAHAAPALLAGRDVLHAFPPSEEGDERWCRVLEAYCAYAAYRAAATAEGTIAARELLDLTGSMRYACSDAAAIGLDPGCAATLQKIEDLRAGFFDRADSQAAVLELWNVFSPALDAFEREIAGHLPLAAYDNLASVARDLVRGERECAQFDREYAFRRAQDIAGYNAELASMRLPFGHLFTESAHPRPVRTLPVMPMMQQVVGNFYRVRQRLAEHARA